MSDIEKDFETPATTPAGGDAERPRWQFGAVELDEASLELRVAGQRVEVEPKPLELLMFLLRRVGEVVTREEILEHLWPGRIVTDGVITNCVAKLRTALGEADAAAVRTVPRYGYRLIAEVRRVVQAAPTEPVNRLGMEIGSRLPGRPHWRLERQLSSGAHGEVWLTRHVKTDEKRVAKFARDADGLTAIKREITLVRVLTQSLGEQAGFVRLLDWNVEEPPYFLETEYSELGNLEDWCAAQGGVAAIPLDTRIEIAAQCAAALAAAHSVGVLHKDLKPSNIIMVKQDQALPRASLCDFAAGHALDPERIRQLGITQLGFTQTMTADGTSGTPFYLAPEVLAGQPATVAADIYSLGILLFQLVVGDFRRLPAPGWERAVDDPMLREDIALTAAGEPAARLADASQLALRLRSLDARRTEWTQRQSHALAAERTRIELVRARARRGLLMGLAATFAFGTVVSAVLYVRAERARMEADTQAAAARAVSDFLTDDLLMAADPRASGMPNVSIRELLDVGAERLEARFDQQPLIRARLQHVIGAAYGTLGETSKAERLLLAAEDTYAQHLGAAARPTQEVRITLRETYRIPLMIDMMGVASRRARDAEEAAGRPNPDLWYEGAWGAHFSECIVRNGGMWLGDCSDRIVELIEQARVELGSEHPTTARMLWIAGVLMDINDRKSQAEPLLREAAKHMARLYAPMHPRVAEARLHWAHTLVFSGQPERGIAILREVLAEFEKTVGADHVFHAMARVFLGRALVAQGQLDEGITLLTSAYRWRLGFHGPTALTTVQGLVPLVQALTAQGRAGEALGLLREAIANIDAAEHRDEIEALRVRVLLGDTLLATGQSAEAGALMADNLDDARRLLVHGQWYLGHIAARRGEWLMAQGQRDEGIALLREGLEILERSRGPDHARTKAVRAALAQAETRT